MTLLSDELFIDRTDERAWLDDLLRQGARQRILLLRANSGFGKSLLLGKYLERIDEGGHIHALIQLDRGGIDAIAFLAALCHQWGWQRFPAFHQAMARLATPGTIEVRQNFQLGVNRSQISLPEAPAQRRAQVELLTAAWFQDVHSWLQPQHPAVILVDAYNLAGTVQRPPTVEPELHSWMEDVFLTNVQQTPALRLILAGQQTPERRLTPWTNCCAWRELGPIHSLEEWQQYAERVGATVTQEVISAFCHAEGGHPYAIAMKLMTLRNWSFGL